MSSACRAVAWRSATTAALTPCNARIAESCDPVATCSYAAHAALTFSSNLASWSGVGDFSAARALVKSRSSRSTDARTASRPRNRSRSDPARSYSLIASANGSRSVVTGSAGAVCWR